MYRARPQRFSAAALLFVGKLQGGARPRPTFNELGKINIVGLRRAAAVMHRCYVTNVGNGLDRSACWFISGSNITKRNRQACSLRICFGFCV